MNRTIENLRNTIDGKIYIYCDNEKIGSRFMAEAGKEGYRFGKIKPTENVWSNIIALKNKKQLRFVRMCNSVNFQNDSGKSEGLTKIDYEKYVNGAKNFIFKDKPFNKTTIKSEKYGDITITGNDCFDATVKFKELLETNMDINSICKNIENDFDVVVLLKED